MILMVIAHLTATFFPYRGGTGNVAYHNARLAAAAGHEVTVFTPQTAGVIRDQRLDGFAVRRIKPWVRIGNAAFLPTLVKELRSADLIHFHYPFFGAEAAVVAAQLGRTPLVITYHQDVHLRGVAGSVARLLRRTLGCWTLRSAVRVCFTSADYAAASHSRPLLAGREETIGVLSNGVDTGRFFPATPTLNLHRQYGIVPDARLVLLVAKLDHAHYFKGIEIALQALTQLPHSITLVVVGDGALRSHYEAYAVRLGVQQQVRFVGAVESNALPDFYRSVDVTILPSTTMGEAFGLVLVESLACGTPVIASDLPGVRSVVSSGSDGLLIPARNASALGEAITALLQDESRRYQMGMEGHRKVMARYQWNTIGSDLLNLYDTAVRQRRASAVPMGER
jgi:glycosyltransferase involved in cell wall biosynthesis